MPELRYLSEADVRAALPSPARAVELARAALTARASGDAQVPAKPQVLFGENAFANGALRTAAVTGACLSALARTCTVWSDDVDQFAAVAPVKLGEDYPLATGWTGDLLDADGAGSSGRLLIQNLGNAASDIVIAADVSATATRQGIGAILPR